MKKRPIIERVGDFMAGKGFYIVLLLCVTALGVSGYYLFSGLAGPDAPVSGNVSMTVTATPAPAKQTGAPRTSATPQPIPAPPTTATPLPTATPKPTAAPTPAPASTKPVPTPTTATASVFTWPVKGELLRPWSVDALSYDETMGDWRVHDGIDIAAEEGTPVMAPAGGTVSDIYRDDLMGATVVILHANDVISVCSNLEEAPSVEIGQTVRTGDVIGSVGTTALAESAQKSHLHLSMTKSGTSVDPVEYLPEH